MITSRLSKAITCERPKRTGAMALASLAAQLAGVPESNEVKDLLCGIWQLSAGCNKESLRALARRWGVSQKLHGKNKSLKVLSEDIQKQLRTTIQAAVGASTGAGEPGGTEGVGEDTGAGEPGGEVAMEVEAVLDDAEEPRGRMVDGTVMGQGGGDAAMEVRCGRRRGKRQESSMQPRRSEHWRWRAWRGGRSGSRRRWRWRAW